MREARRENAEAGKGEARGESGAGTENFPRTDANFRRERKGGRGNARRAKAFPRADEAGKFSLEKRISMPATQKI